MRFYGILLYPFACLYGLATAFRNKMFDAGLKKETSFDVPTVVVGNLAMGGTGKTPMIEFLIRELKEKYGLTVLSRGYGRKTTGFLLANDRHLPRDIGDEPFQIYQKFGKEVSVAVGEERILAVPMILANRPGTHLILLDDAFQHRYLKADFNILLTTYQNPFFKDSLFPLGTLREARKNAARAALVIVTKCPENMDGEQRAYYRKQVSAYVRPGTPVVFTRIKYGTPSVVLAKKRPVSEHVVIVTGIANNQIFVEEVRSRYNVLEILTFPDHHRYTERDIGQIKRTCSKYVQKDPWILTTEKDAVKLNDEKFLSLYGEIPIFALPIEVEMEREDRQKVIGMIEQVISKKAIESGN
ncbi:tetraacyldisaccharide 4'-kinase [Negadavirga shengliensis]|uniref:Tetraacyldisaccharide 4'-kinase n=1 Tax=Negadavirga shengliensis TaxID=1389218 RepID=A0ABV9T270_9BACT